MTFLVLLCKTLAQQEQEQKAQFSCHQMRFLGSKWPTNASTAGAPPRTPLAGAYGVLPDLLAGLRGPTSKVR